MSYHDRRGSGSGLILLCILLFLPFLGWSGTRIIRAIQFDRECSGHLKRAADANTVDRAETELSRAITYIESRGFTEGHTSVLYTTPDEDVGFWYGNLREALDELRGVPADAARLERSNVLMKLRETLLDAGEHGDELTIPMGISVYPHNALFAWWGWIGLFSSVGVVVILLIRMFRDP